MKTTKKPRLWSAHPIKSKIDKDSMDSGGISGVQGGQNISILEYISMIHPI